MYKWIVAGLLAMTCLTGRAWAQVNSTADKLRPDTIYLPGAYPVRIGYVVKRADKVGLVNPIPGVKIYAGNAQADTVFSLSDGKVMRAGEIDGEPYCLVRSEDRVIMYHGPLLLVITEGANIRHGEVLGRMQEEEGVKYVWIQVGRGVKR